MREQQATARRAEPQLMALTVAAVLAGRSTARSAAGWERADSRDGLQAAGRRTRVSRATAAERLPAPRVSISDITALKTAP